MQKQSARIWYKGKDHKDIYFQGQYHCAAYIGDELVWEKYIDGKWVFNAQVGTNILKIKTLDPIKKEVKEQALNTSPNTNHSSSEYIVYGEYVTGFYGQSLLVSNAGGNRLNRVNTITGNFKFAAALDDRILVCENYVLYELQQNKEDKSYELLEVGEIPNTLHLFVYGRQGKFLVGYDYNISGYDFYAFGKDNILKQFATHKGVSSIACCQDSEKVYVLSYIQSYVSPYLRYPTVYIYDGSSTTTLHPDFGGRLNADVAMIKRNGKFVIYNLYGGSSNKYVDIYVTEDFSSFETIHFEKCIVPFNDGFEVSAYLQGTRTYHNVAFVADVNRTTVDEDTYKVKLPIRSIESEIPVYYDSGEIDDNREDMVFPFTINGFTSSTFLVAYLDNLYFEESDGNFGR